MNITVQKLYLAVPHILQFTTVMGVVVTMGWFVVKPRAEEFIDGRVNTKVEDRLAKVEESLRKLEFNAHSDATIRAVQNEQLRSINETQKLMLRLLTGVPDASRTTGLEQ